MPSLVTLVDVLVDDVLVDVVVVESGFSTGVLVFSTGVIGVSSPWPAGAPVCDPVWST